MNEFLVRYNVPCLVDRRFFVKANNHEDALDKSIKIIENEEDVCFKKYFEIISLGELADIPRYE